MRFAAGVEYDGQHFHGWQSQGDVRTVQDAVETAFSSVANHPVSVITAGRTDTGVHATGQVIHFDSHARRSNLSWLRGANTNLPKDVVIAWVRPVSEEFHARFSALERAYRYIIYNRPNRSACFFGKVSMEYRPLDLSRMQLAADSLVGEHDFSSFRAAGCQARSPVREIRSMQLTREPPYIYLDVRANAFLQHMVRNLAGVLMTIGAGEREPQWAQQVLRARDRKLGGVTASPHGLYLTEVVYPEKFELPQNDYGFPRL